MITDLMYKAAIASKEAAEKVINAYHQKKDSDFKERWEKFEKGEQFFTDDELRYSAGAKCEGCGAGLAYPKDCGGFHRWDCSDILTGRKTDRENHASYPFAFYEIKSEDQPSAHGATTRP